MTFEQVGGKSGPLVPVRVLSDLTNTLNSGNLSGRSVTLRLQISPTSAFDRVPSPVSFTATAPSPTPSPTARAAAAVSEKEAAKASIISSLKGLSEVIKQCQIKIRQFTNDLDNAENEMTNQEARVTLPIVREFKATLRKAKVLGQTIKVVKSENQLALVEQLKTSEKNIKAIFEKFEVNSVRIINLLNEKPITPKPVIQITQFLQ